MTSKANTDACQRCGGSASLTLVGQKHVERSFVRGSYNRKYWHQVCNGCGKLAKDCTCIQ